MNIADNGVALWQSDLLSGLPHGFLGRIGGLDRAPGRHPPA